MTLEPTSGISSTDAQEQSYRAEVEAALDADEQRLGDVWRRLNLSPEEIAKELDVSTISFVYSYRRIIDAIVEGKLPTAPTPARQVASALRGFVWRHNLTEEANRSLVEKAEACEQIANDQKRIHREDEEALQRTEEAEKAGTPGVYVYTYPHYRRHPVVPGETYEGTGAGTRDRTYLKVGVSGQDAKGRVAQQMRGTAIPEGPLLLRIYTASPGSDDLHNLESRLHQHLRAADHARAYSRSYGDEWFLSHLPFLDDTAELLGMKVTYAMPEDEETA